MRLTGEDVASDLEQSQVCLALALKCRRSELERG